MRQNRSNQEVDERLQEYPIGGLSSGSTSCHNDKTFAFLKDFRFFVGFLEGVGPHIQCYSLWDKIRYCSVHFSTQYSFAQGAVVRGILEIN